MRETSFPVGWFFLPKRTISLSKRAEWTLSKNHGSLSRHLYNSNPVSHSVEIGYELHAGHWRQGIMSEALSAMIDYCFSARFAFPLNRIEALTDVAHIASLGLLSKLGFQEEGIRREYGYWKSNFHDLRAFSLLRRDWEYDQRLTREQVAQPSDARGDADSRQPGDSTPAGSRQQSRLRGWIV